MTTGSVKSGIFPTAEEATSSLDGALTDIGKGQEVSVVGISTIEVEGGFIAVATLEITDIEEDEEPESEVVTEKQERSSESPEASEDYYITDLSRGSVADSLPNVEDDSNPGAPSESTDVTEGETGSAGEGDNNSSIDVQSSFDEQRIDETAVESENIMVPVEERIESAQLSEALKTDFDVAQNDDGLLAAAAFTNSDAQLALLKQEEDEDARKKRKIMTEQLLASVEAPALTE